MNDEERYERLRRWVEQRKDDPSHKAWLASVQQEITTGDVSEGYSADQLAALFRGERMNSAGGSGE